MKKGMKLALAIPAAVAATVGLSAAGLAIASAGSQSPANKFKQQEASQPKLTSAAVLERAGARSLSQHVGRAVRADEIASSATLGDGTVLAPPPANASTSVSQEDAWNAFVAYGSPPNVYVLASTPAPTIQLAQISKTNSPDGGSLSNRLVWVIQYQDVAVYNAAASAQAASAGATGPSEVNPASDTGYLDVFVDATTGQVLYTTAQG